MAVEAAESQGVTKHQALPPMLVDIQGLSALLQRSVASLRRDEAHGRLPAGIKIGRSKRWCVAEIQAWVTAGAPSQVQNGVATSRMQEWNQAGMGKRLGVQLRSLSRRKWTHLPSLGLKRWIPRWN